MRGCVSHLTHTACCKSTLVCVCGSVDILEQLLFLIHFSRACAHLVLAVKVDDDIFQREASLLAQASQHVSDGQAITCGGQRGAAIR